MSTRDTGITTKEKAQRSAPFAALSGLMSIVFSIAGMLLLVRYLPQEQFGVWAIITGLAIPISLFTSMGYRHSITRFMPVIRDDDERRHSVWSVILRRALLGCAISAVLLLALPLLAPRFDIVGHETLFLLLQPALIFQISNVCVMTSLNAAFKQKEVFYGTFLYQLAYVCVVAYGILRGLDLLYFAVVFSAVAALHLAFNLWSCVRCFGFPSARDLLVRWPEDASARRYRRASWIDDLGSLFISSDISRYIVAAIGGSAEVAIFAVASSVVDRLRNFQPIEIFRPMATVSFFEKFEQSGEIDELNRMFQFLFSANHLVTIFYLALFVPLGAELLALVFRPQYVDAYLPAVFLFSAIGLFALPIGIVAQALRRPEVLIYSKVAILVNLAAGIPLSMEYGAAGMAFAVMLTAGVKNGLTYALLRREFAVRLPWSTMGRFLCAGGAAAAATWLTRPHLPLLVSVVASGLFYLAATRVFRVLNAYERHLLLAMVPERLVPLARLFVGS